MKYIKRIVLLLLVIFLIFIANVLVTTGYFRTIKPMFKGKIMHRIELPGAEDITISQKDSFAIISSTDRNPLSISKQKANGLYFLDLKTKNYTPIHLTADFKKPFSPHGISMYQQDSTYQIMAVNHTPSGHSIEVFSLHGKKLTHLRTLKDPSMVSPNDIVLLDENRFYFTNDHKYSKGFRRLLEDYGGLSVSNIIYFNGENYTEVAKGVAYANGINYDAKRNLLYVASPRGFLVKVYQRNEDGSLDLIEDIDCNTGVDNIDIDSEGNLWIGAHPNLLHFASYAKGKKETSPSELIKITYKSKGDYVIEQIYVENGSEMSASTVAVPFGDLILTGNVMDDEFLILKREP